MAPLSAAACGVLLFAAVAAVRAFHQFPDERAKAGALAGELFAVAYWVTLIVALVALFSGAADSRRKRTLAVFLLAGALLELLVLAPLIREHGAGLPLPFGALHGTAGALHVLLAVGAAALAWTGLAPTQTPGEPRQES